MTSATTRPSAIDMLRALRPNQWTKNAVVAAAFFFAVGDRNQDLAWGAALLTTTVAVAIWCAICSAVYILNDLRDRDADRQHPQKRFRPIAAGRVSPGVAGMIAGGLLAGGLLSSCALPRAFLCAVAAYVVLQLAYTLVLKNVALVDVLVIATGFVLRAMSGAAALRVPISPWLLLCAFLLALFLAVCKRRHEKIQVGDSQAGQRQSLAGYDARLLDQLVSTVAAATIVSYAIYTLSESTIDKFGTAGLGFTIPLVVFGVFRYLDLVYRRQQGDRPEKIVLNDVPLLVLLVLYAASVVAIFALAG
jgi:4-hydroxybenzoate polyprenyltransferase